MENDFSTVVMVLSTDPQADLVKIWQSLKGYSISKAIDLLESMIQKGILKKVYQSQFKEYELIKK